MKTELNDALENLSHTECAALLARVAARLTLLATPAQPPAGKLLTAKQLGAELSLSLDSIYDMARTGRIPVALRQGRALRFDAQAVRRALAQ